VPTAPPPPPGGNTNVAIALCNVLSATASGGNMIDFVTIFGNL
jgi:hypothetical protein